nr:ABC transporter substrate-binding protein [Variovorax paradoxus]
MIAFPGGGNWPLWAAESQGIFARNGLNVEVVPAPSSTFQFSGLSRGEFDIALTALDNIIAYREGQGTPGIDGSDLVAVMGGDHGFLKLVARPDIRGIPDLRGKELSVDALTTGYAFVLLELLARHGFVLDRDYRTVSAGGVRERFEQLLAGQHAATMLVSPFEVLAQARGMQVLEDATGALGSYQGVVAGVRRSWAALNPASVTAFVRAYRQALDWLYMPANKQAALDLFVRNVPAATPQTAAVSYGILLHPVTGFERHARIGEAGMRTVIALREKYGRPAKKLQSIEAYYEPRYYQAASGSA